MGNTTNGLLMANTPSKLSIKEIDLMLYERDKNKQMEISRKIFETLDKDKSGTLDHEELMALVLFWWRDVPWVVRVQITSNFIPENELLESWGKSFFAVLDENKDG